MLSEKLRDVLSHEGVVTIITTGDTLAVTNTWNSYLTVDDDTIYLPAAGMHSIQEILKTDNSLLLTVGSKDVAGTQGPGAGFHITGRGTFLEEGPEFNAKKAQFPWLTRVLQVDVIKAEQKI